VFGVVQVAFEGFGDGLAVAGGEQVEQQAAGNGDGEPGFGPGRDLGPDPGGPPGTPLAQRRIPADRRRPGRGRGEAGRAGTELAGPGDGERGDPGYG
jgi:hypothetical protein